MSNETRTPPKMPMRHGPRPGGRPGGPPGAPVEKAKNFKGTIAKLFKYLMDFKIALITIIAFAIGSTVFSIIGPKILGNATTEIFKGLTAKIQGVGGIDFSKIGQILIFLLCLYITSALFTFVQSFLMTNISQKLTYKLRREICEKIKKMPMSYFESTNVGETLSIITNDVDTLSTSLNQSATQIITSFVTVIGVLIMMFSINWVMTLASLIIIPFSAIVTGIVAKKSQKHFVNQQKYLGHVNGQVEEVFSGHNIVRAYNAEERAELSFAHDNDKLYESAWKSQFLSGLIPPITHLISNLSYVAIVMLGGYFVINGKIQVGDIQSFTQYNRNFSQPITQLAQVSNMLQTTAAAAERVFEFLDIAEEPVVEKSDISVDDLCANVEFSHVHFGYKPEKIIINDFSAKVHEGQKIAIVGPTGAGKTTMIKLLMRFYDVNDGAIFIDGHNIKEFERDDLRKMFGMVLQDTWLFSGTIMENIRYGNTSATDDEVIAAAKSAHVHRFVQTLPDSYNMVLNEEASNVSQGQKQLLTIARAILADPKILILDEATSSVDTRTEVRIQKAMDNLMKGRTSFIIAHRLSTIKNADLILVMKDGDIIEQGTHDGLMEQKGFYSELYMSQFEKTS